MERRKGEVEGLVRRVYDVLEIPLFTLKEYGSYPLCIHRIGLLKFLVGSVPFLPAALAEAGLEITFQVGPSGMDCWRGR